MKQKNALRLAWYHNVSVISLRLILVAAFLSIFAVSSAFGQSMPMEVAYSDTWTTQAPTQESEYDSEGTHPYAAVGFGQTDASYNSAGHEYRIEATITSPNGRTASATGYGETSGASVEISLPWDWQDTGDYVLDTVHYAFCPIANREYIVALLQVRLPFGASINVMQYQVGTSNPYVYRAIPNCNVLCPVVGYIRPDYAGQYVWLIVPRAPFGCLRGSIVRRFAPVSPCFDIP